MYTSSDSKGLDAKGSLEMDPFVESLLPSERSKVLVIAGDLGHDNEQNYALLKSLKSCYNSMLVVAGNHDYYLVSNKQRKQHRSSMKRWSNMKELASTLEGVHFLEGDICELDGIRFGGTGMWYDFSYGIQMLGKSLSYMVECWAKGMNDANYTILPNTLEMYWEQKARLDQVIHDCDVIITHVSPDWSHIEQEFRADPLSGCYYFDGSDRARIIGRRGKSQIYRWGDKSIMNEQIETKHRPHWV